MTFRCSATSAWQSVATRWLLVAALGMFTACNRDDSQSSGTTARADGSSTSAADGEGQGPADAPTDSPPQTAQSVFDRLLATYKAAKTYQDEAVVRLLIKHPQGNQEEAAKVAVAFARPNRLRIGREGVEIVSDGSKVHGKPEGWNGQVLVVDAPNEIRVPAFYAVESLAPLLTPDLTGNSIQLDLLAADKPLQNIRDEDAEPELLDGQQIDGHMCDGVRFNTDMGPLTLWVDRQTTLLRRVNFPAGRLKEALAGQGVEDVQLTADFVGAALDQQIDDAVFTWSKTDDEVFVRQLIPPPDPRFQPHPTLGKTVPAFAISPPEGDDKQSTEWNGKVTVIDFWATWCPYCIQGMPNFAKAQQHFADNDKVRFVALSVDSSDVSDKVIGATLKQTGVDTPWARAAETNPYEAIQERFQLPGIPACVILDKEGRVQYHHVGADLDTDKELPEKIEQLIDGKDLAAEANKAWETLQQEYEKEIQLARVDVQSNVIEIQRAEIKPRSEPDTFRLKELWQNKDFATAGNLLVVPSSGDGDEAGIFVVDGFRSVVHLDGAGEVVAKHEDIVPKDSIVTYLRSAKDADGQPIFVGGGLAQPHFYVFDDEWQVVLTHPEAGSAAVYDVEPADLDGDGAVEFCVAYFREAGVHGVSLDGTRLWRNRSITNVSDLAVTSPDDEGHRRVLCAHSFGSLVPIDHDGSKLDPIEVSNRAITHVTSADLDDDGLNEIAVIAIDTLGQRFAMGLAEDGQVIWEHPLPSGEHQAPVESIVAGRLFPGQPARWLFAAADGSIHIISIDGKETDQFDTGQTLTGLAVAEVEGQGVLLIASNELVTALAVSKNEP